MVTVEQLRISDNGRTLYIDAHINEASYFNNLFFDKIVIQTEDQVLESCTMPEKEYVYSKNIDENGEVSDDASLSDVRDAGARELHLRLNVCDLNERFNGKDFSRNMFFVFFATKGTPDPCTPCRLDERVTLAVTFDYGLIYNNAMGFTRQLGRKCEIPDNFINFILLLQALKMAIETEHYIPAIQYYRLLMNTATNGLAPATPCGCHG